MKAGDQIDCLVVGAGFAGSVVARELADAGLRVHVADRRLHVAGNAFDALNASGVLIHHYGPHIFHTLTSASFNISPVSPSGDLMSTGFVA